MRSTAHHHSAGFGMAIAIMLIMTGSLVLSFVVMGAAIAYSESVNKRIERVQASFNEQACNDVIELVREKDVFVTGWIEIPEFDCKRFIK